MFVVLMGPPAIGKSESIKMSRTMLRQEIAGKEKDKFHIGPDSISYASLVDALDEYGERHVMRYGEEEIVEIYNSIFMMPDELSSFMPKWDEAIIGGLTHFYDIVPFWDFKRTNKVDKSMDSVQLSLLAGTTPGNFHQTIKPHIWEQGFLSRTIIVYADKKPFIEDIFDVEVRDDGDLRHDLQMLFALDDQFSMSKDYKDAFNAWRCSGCAPAPTHPKFAHYCGRREVHLHKLAMISCADRGDNLTIGIEDYQRGLGWLLEAEQQMPAMFGVSTSNDMGIIEDISHTLDGTPMLATKFLRLLGGKVDDSRKIGPIIETMKSMGLIKEEFKGGVKYVRRL